MKDLSFIEFADDDTDVIRAMKTYWQTVMAMPEAERKVFLQEEYIREEEQYLNWMIARNTEDDHYITRAGIQIRRAMKDYELHKDDASLEKAEQWLEIARGTKEVKYTIGDIRKQREKIWREKKRLKTLKDSLKDELSPSSEDSAT